MVLVVHAALNLEFDAMVRETIHKERAAGDSKPKPLYRLALLGLIVGLSAIALYVAGFDVQSLCGWWQTKPTSVADGPPRSEEPISDEGQRMTLEAPRGNDSSASPVPLALVLVSTQPGPQPTMGKALIGVFRDTPQTYVGGALLANGARLARIYDDHVVLEKDGHSVRLYRVLNPKSQAKNDSEISNPLLTVGGAPAVVTPVLTSRDVLTEYIRPSPVYDDDQLIGFEVYAGSKPGVFTQWGLKSGDVVTSLDGLPLTEATSSWEAFKQLERGMSLSATVRRAGGVQAVYLDGQLIIQAQQLAAQRPVISAIPPGG